MKKILIVLTLPFLFMNISEKNTAEKSAKKFLDEQIEKGQTPSVQYVLFNQNEILYQYRNGYSDLKNKIPTDSNTTFNAYSITKTFTALAVLQLAEKNIIDINKPVRYYMPDHFISEKITIKHLLSHTSGIKNPIPLTWIHLPEEHKSFDRSTFFYPILKKSRKTKSAPGQKFSYSNLGYVVLGQLIESVTGISYEQYVKENILNKLSVQNNELGFTIEKENMHAKGYHAKKSFSLILLGFFINKSKYMEPSEGKWKPFKNHYVNGAPYGGLIGTSNAFVKYGQALLKDDNLLLSKGFKHLLFTENKTSDNKPTGMCLSWFKGSLNGITYYSHAGGGGGYYCEIRLYPEIKAGSFIVFNRTGFTDERFLDKVDKYTLQWIKEEFINVHRN